MFQAELSLELHEIGAVKFGSFTLTSGIISPIYIDLRLIISYPLLLKKISQALYDKMRGLSFDLICGVPYTALPIATALSVANDIPMIMRRKEAREHGTKKSVEGVFQPHQRCLIIEDIITSGKSILETKMALEKEGLTIKDVLVVIDRQQGGKTNLEREGLNVHSLLSLSSLLNILKSSGKINKETESACLL